MGYTLLAHLHKYLIYTFFISVISVSFVLTGCVSDTAYAPVVNVSDLSPQYYRVKRGDTLYSIAWLYGLDYRSLARHNHISPPYEIQPGQRLALNASALPISVVKPKPKRRPSLVSTPKKSAVRRQKMADNQPIKRWLWPARGRVVQGYSSKLGGNHGINIAGRYGEPVRAAARGKVVYSGNGVRGYGNLVIIKHNDRYLSAYAYNKRALVSLGQRVQAGQPIAQMGRNDAGAALLHFEIRKDGKPINPSQHLR